MAHALLHNRAKDTEEKTPELSRSTEEVQAESISYAVCAYYGIATGDNSFGYIASWSKDKTLPELRESLEVISKTAGRSYQRYRPALCGNPERARGGADCR